MWADRFSVAGKVVFLTGAAGGIGLALVKAFLEGGARVFAVTRRQGSDWQGLDTRFGDALLPVFCHLESENEVLNAIKKAESQYPIDVLLNNASETPREPVNFYDIEVFRKTFAVNFEAAYLLCGYLAPRMAERGNGSIINITSINAERAFPGNPSYVVSKGALRMLTKALARDFGERGVRANNVSPGYVHTRMTAASFADRVKNEERRSHTMLGRWAAPEDIVGSCLFLASDASAYITGTDLVVDGGWLAKGL